MKFEVIYRDFCQNRTMMRGLIYFALRWTQPVHLFVNLATYKNVSSISFILHLTFLNIPIPSLPYHSHIRTPYRYKQKKID